MSTQTRKHGHLKEAKPSIRGVLASLWASFMFLYIYVDYFHLYMPNSLEDMLAGRVFVFDVTQSYLVAALISVMIPALMIFLSVALPAEVNRWTQIVIATIYIPYTLVNLAGEAWVHMMIGAGVEVGLLLLVIRYAWTWPRVEAREDFEGQASDLRPTA
ncbi:MAG: hypothetical protein DCF29_15670 [Alphaproteobacteria bacterium]|nr:MAG: hypothetical protein DCF29_15670 [Alphaproteobacteria bacterium]